MDNSLKHIDIQIDVVSYNGTFNTKTIYRSVRGGSDAINRGDTDKGRYAIDSNRYEIDSNIYEIDRGDINKGRYEIDTIVDKSNIDTTVNKSNIDTTVDKSNIDRVIVKGINAADTIIDKSGTDRSDTSSSNTDKSNTNTNRSDTDITIDGGDILDIDDADISKQIDSNQQDKISRIDSNTNKPVDKNRSQVSKKIDYKSFGSVVFFPEDRISEFKDKIYLITGIMPFQQHMYIYPKSEPLRYRIIADGVHSIDIEKHFSNSEVSVVDIPVDLELYQSRDYLQVIAEDYFTTISNIVMELGGSSLHIKLYNLDDFLTRKDLVSELSTSNVDQFSLLYWGFIIKFFPMLSYDAFKEYLGSKFTETYSDLIPPDHISRIYNGEKIIIENKYNLTEDALKGSRKYPDFKKFYPNIDTADLSIKSATISVSRYHAPLNIRNLFDLLHTSTDIPIIKANLFYKQAALTLTKIRSPTLSEKDPNYIQNIYNRTRGKLALTTMNSILLIINIGEISGGNWGIDESTSGSVGVGSISGGIDVGSISGGIDSSNEWLIDNNTDDELISGSINELVSGNIDCKIDKDANRETGNNIDRDISKSTSGGVDRRTVSGSKSIDDNRYKINNESISGGKSNRQTSKSINNRHASKSNNKQSGITTSTATNLHSDITLIAMNINSQGMYKIRIDWDSELSRLSFKDINRLLTRWINPIIEKINTYSRSVFTTPKLLTPINRYNTEYTNLDVEIYWDRAITYEDFLVLQQEIKPYYTSKIFGAYMGPTNRYSFMFYAKKGMVEDNYQDLEKVITVQNYYAYLTDTKIKQKFKSMFGFGKLVDMTYRSSDVKITISGVGENEFNIFYYYLITFLYNASKKFGKGKSSSDDIRNNLKVLKSRDPELFDFKKQGSNLVYSRLCQKQYQPIMYDMPIPKIAMTKYWNFTANRPVYYRCPNCKYPYLSFITGKHPKDYCLPCCRKMDVGDYVRTRKDIIYTTCLTKHMYSAQDSKLGMTRYVINYGKIIEIGRISFLPDILVRFLTYNLEDKKILTNPSYRVFTLNGKMYPIDRIIYTLRYSKAITKPVSELLSELDTKVDKYTFKEILLKPELNLDTYNAILNDSDEVPIIMYEGKIIYGIYKLAKAYKDGISTVPVKQLHPYQLDRIKPVSSNISGGVDNEVSSVVSKNIDRWIDSVVNKNIDNEVSSRVDKNIDMSVSSVAYSGIDKRMNSRIGINISGGIDMVVDSVNSSGVGSMINSGVNSNIGSKINSVNSSGADRYINNIFGSGINNNRQTNIDNNQQTNIDNNQQTNIDNNRQTNIDNYAGGSIRDINYMRLPGYYMYGVEQNNANLSNIGSIYSIAMALRITVKQFIDTCIAGIDREFSNLLRGNINMYFESAQHLIDVIKFIFLNETKFNPKETLYFLEWNELFIELTYYCFNTIVITLEDTIISTTGTSVKTIMSDNINLVLPFPIGEFNEHCQYILLLKRSKKYPSLFNINKHYYPIFVFIPTIFFRENRIEKRTYGRSDEFINLLFGTTEITDTRSRFDLRVIMKFTNKIRALWVNNKNKAYAVSIQDPSGLIIIPIEYSNYANMIDSSIKIHKGPVDYDKITISLINLHKFIDSYNKFVVIESEKMKSYKVKGGVDNEIDNKIDNKIDSEIDNGTDNEIDNVIGNEIDSDQQININSEIDSGTYNEIDSEIDSGTYNEIDSEIDSEIDNEINSDQQININSGTDSAIDNVIDNYIGAGSLQDRMESVIPVFPFIKISKIIVRNGSAVGFRANGMSFYCKPGKNIYKYEVLQELYNPKHIDIAVETTFPVDKISKSFHSKYLYDLYLLHLFRHLDKERNSSMRSKIVSLLPNINSIEKIVDEDDFAQIDTYNYEFLKHNSKKQLVESFLSGVYRFDQITLNKLDNLTAKYNRLSVKEQSKISEEVYRILDSISKKIVSIGLPTDKSINNINIAEGKLYMTKEQYKEVLGLVSYQFTNPNVRILLIKSLMLHNVKDYFNFNKYPGEEVYMLIKK